MKRKPRPPIDSTPYRRQSRLSVYGHGPFNEEDGQPMGCMDVASITMLPGFVVVEEPYLTALEQLVHIQQARIAQLEAIHG